MHFDNPIFIIIVIVAAVLRWLSKKSEAKAEDPERPEIPNEPIPRNEETRTEEERIRRFLEALGQPADSKPPPRVAPKRQRPMKPRTFPNILPPLTTVPPPLIDTSAAPVETPPPLPVERRVFTPAVVQELSFEVRDISAPSVKPLEPQTRRATAGRPGFPLRFESTEDLRNAILLREILGPPRSLQPLESLL